VNGTCVAATKANKGKRACTRFVASGAAVNQPVTAAGTITAKLPGRLRPGQRYRVQASAGSTKVVSAAFGVR
jgi:hypothetical protein